MSKDFAELWGERCAREALRADKWEALYHVELASRLLVEANLETALELLEDRIVARNQPKAAGYARNWTAKAARFVSEIRGKKTGG